MSNVITAYFKGRTGVAEAVYQNDYGMIMAFDGIYLPAHFDCYFSVSGSEEAIPGIGADNRVAIPNAVLAVPGKVEIHIPMHTGENDSEVEYVVYFKVINRSRPVDDGTPVQMTAIEQALALLQNPIGNIETIVEEALSFTGETFEEMQEDLTEWKGGVEEGLDTWKDGVEDGIDTFETQVMTMVGTPLVAGTVAGMTDHSKIYVYTGSETGYTAGNWYYWNGSAWTSGGTYNSTAFTTDTTLTASGAAADSKTVGDKVSALKEDLGSLYPTSIYNSSANTNGYYYDPNGQVYPYPGWNITGKFPVKYGYKYKYSGLNNRGNSPRFAIFNSESVIISLYKPVSASAEIPMPYGSAYIAFSIKDDDLSTFDATEQNNQDQEDITGIVTGIDKVVQLESGSLRNTGETYDDSRRVRFANIVKVPFSCSVNDGYLVRTVVKYDEDEQVISYTSYTDKTEFYSDGSFGIKLIFCKTNLEATTPVTDSIIKTLYGTIDTLAHKVNRMEIGNCTLQSLPSASDRSFVICDKPKSLLWSDRYCWRFTSDNNLAIVGTAYKTIKISDGSTVNSQNADTVYHCYSTTKLLSTLVATMYISDYTDTVTIINSDTTTTYASFVQVGDVASYDTLLHSAIIQSDNNAARSLARPVGYIIDPTASTDSYARIAFFNEMKRVATDVIGMSNCDFTDMGAYTGLQTTASDFCKLLKYIQDNSTKIKSIWKMLTYTVTVGGDNARSWGITSTTSSDARLIIPEFEGGKTGSGGDYATYAFVWKDASSNYYATMLMQSTSLISDARFYDSRQIINEALSLV